MTTVVGQELTRSEARTDTADYLQSPSNHLGQSRTSDSELFEPAPAAIGHVLSAESTLTVGQREHLLQWRITTALLPTTMLACAMLWVTRNQMTIAQGELIVFAVAVAAVGSATIWHFTRFVHRCTYVGEEGIAIFELRRRPDAQPSSEVLLFKDAAELRASQTRHTVNLRYTNTTYDYQWTDPVGRRFIRLKGKYVGKNRPPKAGDAFHFASAAERAWSAHYLSRAERQLQEKSFIAFRVGVNRTVRIGFGFIEFHFDEEPVRIRREQIGKVALWRGMFSFIHNDAKWYRNSGKYRFHYGQVANAKVFLFVLEKLLGYRWD